MSPARSQEPDALRPGGRRRCCRSRPRRSWRITAEALASESGQALTPAPEHGLGVRLVHRLDDDCRSIGGARVLARSLALVRSDRRHALRRPLRAAACAIALPLPALPLHLRWCSTGRRCQAVLPSAAGVGAGGGRRCVAHGPTVRPAAARPHYSVRALQPLSNKAPAGPDMAYSVAAPRDTANMPASADQGHERIRWSEWEGSLMARAFRLWVEQDPVTGQAGARARRVHAVPGRGIPAKPWAETDTDAEWRLGAPWALLLAFLNLERRVPPYDWPRHQWIEGYEPEWEDWRQFQRATGAPYLLTEDQGHPLLWFPAADGELWGVLFNFGLRGGGGWYWWVPGTERVVRDPTTGGTMIIMAEAHPEAPDGKTIRDLLAAAPPGRFEVDPAQYLTVQEALDGELQRHAADERNRCRFFVYPAGAEVHGRSLRPEYGLQTAEAQREALASIAWTCLSPQPALWNAMFCADWRSEVGGHLNPEPDDPEAERRLAAMAPAERFARIPAQTFWGPSHQAFADNGNPLVRFLDRLTPAPRIAPTTASRVLTRLQEKAAGALEAEAPSPTTLRELESGSRARREQAVAARRRLGRALAVGEAYTTTDIFAAVAQQIVWAVQVGLTIRACGHPHCGRAFIPETGKHLYCPEHRSGTARAQRARAPRPGVPPWMR